MAEVTSQEVAAFLNANAWRYLDVLRVVKDLLADYMASDEGRGVVYTIYSRGQKQRGGGEFKDVWQIKWNVNESRRGDEPLFAIQDVDDIIGVTLVCNYRWQIELAEKFLLSCEKAGNLVVLEAEDKDLRGYKARHLVVGLPDPKYTGIQCELQLKSVLHDAWARWAHDLIYKPRGALPIGMYDQMAAVSKQLEATDEMIAAFKRQIEQSWDRLRERREASSFEIVSAMWDVLPDDDERRQTLGPIAQELIDHPTKYRASDVGGILQRIEDFADGSYDLPVCWAITTLAALREDDDLDQLALDRIERCIGASDELVHRIGAFSLKAQALFMFNQLPDAVEASLLALDCAQRYGNEETLALCRLNVATFLAELGDKRMGPSARALMAKVKEFRDGEENLQRVELDTLGLVEIVFGETREAVAEGMRLCKAALAKEPENPAAQRYCELHTLLAEDKLAQLAAGV
jgi:hypothetical protein